MRKILALAFVFLCVGVQITSASEEVHGIEQANQALQRFVTEETIESLAAFNRLQFGKDGDNSELLNADLIGQTNDIIKVGLPKHLSAAELGNFPLNEDIIRNIIIYSSKVTSLLDKENPIKERLLMACELYRAWNNTEHPDVNRAIEIIYNGYEEDEGYNPIWTRVWNLDFSDKVVFNFSFVYSSMIAYPKFRYTSLSILSAALFWRIYG